MPGLAAAPKNSPRAVHKDVLGAVTQYFTLCYFTL